MLLDTFQAQAPDCFHCPYNLKRDSCGAECFEHLEQLVTENAGQIAGVIIEPMVQGAAGMRIYSPVYLQKLRQLCDEQQVHYIAKASFEMIKRWVVSGFTSVNSFSFAQVRQSHARKNLCGIGFIGDDKDRYHWIGDELLCMFRESAEIDMEGCRVIYKGGIARAGQGIFSDCSHDEAFGTVPKFTGPFAGLYQFFRLFGHLSFRFPEDDVNAL